MGQSLEHYRCRNCNAAPMSIYNGWQNLEPPFVFKHTNECRRPELQKRTQSFFHYCPKAADCDYPIREIYSVSRLPVGCKLWDKQKQECRDGQYTDEALWR
jgi:hypothetical protein